MCVLVSVSFAHFNLRLKMCQLRKRLISALTLFKSEVPTQWVETVVKCDQSASGETRVCFGCSSVLSRVHILT